MELRIFVAPYDLRHPPSTRGMRMALNPIPTVLTLERSRPRGLRRPPEDPRLEQPFRGAFISLLFYLATTHTRGGLSVVHTHTHTKPPNRTRRVVRGGTLAQPATAPNFSARRNFQIVTGGC